MKNSHLFGVVALVSLGLFGCTAPEIPASFFEQSDLEQEADGSSEESDALPEMTGDTVSLSDAGTSVNEKDANDYMAAIMIAKGGG